MFNLDWVVHEERVQQLRVRSWYVSTFEPIWILSSSPVVTAAVTTRSSTDIGMHLLSDVFGAGGPTENSVHHRKGICFGETTCYPAYLQKHSLLPQDRRPSSKEYRSKAENHDIQFQSKIIVRLL